MIEIDGAAGEGGGQLLRTSLALSMCTGQPFSMNRIRAGRQARPDAPAPGCVIAAAEISGAQVQGAELNSQSLSFAPGKPRAGDYRFHLGTAGSCGLLLQTLWPALMMANGPAACRWRRHAQPAAPPFHFLARSYAPLLARLGAKAELNLLRMGFYPAGGGEIEARIWPAADQLEPFDLIARARRPPAMPNAMRRAAASSGASWNIWARRWAGPGISCAWPPRASTKDRATRCWRPWSTSRSARYSRASASRA